MSESRRTKQPASHAITSIATSNLPGLADDEQTHESPRDFLHGCGGSVLLQDAMSAVLQTRPKDPLSFLSEHFGSLMQPKNGFQNAYDKLSSSHYSKDIFESILVDAYQGFKEKRSKNGLQGLQGETHNELLVSLIKELPNNLSEKVLNRLIKPEKQSISFTSFRKDILTVLMYKDFIDVAKLIYKDIDFAGRGRCDRQLCNLFLDEFQSVLAGGTHNKLTSSQIKQILFRYNETIETSQTKAVINQEEFVELAAKAFINQH